MNPSFKKRVLLILGVVLLILALLGGLFYFTVNTMFSKVTKSLSQSNVLDDGVGGIWVPGKDGAKVFVTLDSNTVNALEGKIPTDDKARVLAILARALPEDTYKTVLSYIKGGITEEEFLKVYALMKEHLTQAEKKQIKSYYEKYLHLLSE